MQGLKQSLVAKKTLTKKEVQEPFGKDFKEWGSHARVGHPTQDTSRIKTARVKQEEEVDIRMIVKELHEIWKKETWAL